ncbi:MAG: Ni/Fe hydrogenase subunit alpha [Bacteroidetes bacterium]|nr:MAG: Ni/Fe hydrogenase subunit alpha [Bacteroidota bacterium]
MGEKIIIEPVTRVEGHGKVSIHLDADGHVTDARLHIVEFRGFERFIQGRPYWEAPVLVQRLCGICPVSHHLAAAKAIDQLVGVDPADLPPAAEKLRRLLHYGQIFQSHALHFFYLAAPDLVFGLDAPAAQRHVLAVAAAQPELAKQGILMRKFGQEIIRAVAGKRIHGTAARPGGMFDTFQPGDQKAFLEGTPTMPGIDTMVEWAQASVAFFRTYHAEHQAWLDTFAAYPSAHLSMLAPDGSLDLYDGRLQAIDAAGGLLLDLATDDYQTAFLEGVEPWSYMKFPFLRHLGREEGWYRVGPLARLNVCQRLSTPLADAELQVFKAYTSGMPNGMTMHTHWARLIELLHAAEVMRDLLRDPDLGRGERVAQGTPRQKGIGILEAPRGTLIHHYEIDDKDLITRCNLIVSTTHNNEAMNRAVRWVAQNVLDGKSEISEPMLNQVEVAIRAYDPCLSCATHALGQMPLILELYDHQGNCIDTRVRD